MTVRHDTPFTGRALQLAVFRQDDTWRLLRDGENFGRFRTSDAARACAMRLYQETRGRGEAAELLIHDGWGQIRDHGRVA